MAPVTLIALLAFLLIVGLLLFLRWGMNWGSARAEHELEMPGDEYLGGGPAARVVMTRAIAIEAEPEIVWPWLAQLGRGAGWYSYDRLDNGGRTSAEHIVSWIPAPAIGDATPTGYLRHIEPGRSLVWWAEGARFAGATTRLVVDIQLTPDGGTSRLVIRMSADAKGLTAPLALLAFRVIDSIMARRQLLGIRGRVERHGARSSDPERPETGAPDQYQFYEAIYASGELAGLRGKEHAQRWRTAAIDDGVVLVAAEDS
ncbi:MAG: hypothetical protein GY769_03715 [bacterium]|nr:hypothetical protein [bacterium]